MPETGRPPIPYDPELGDLICERIATTPHGLARILEDIRAEKGADADVPSLRVVYRWLEMNEAFQQQSARARALQADTLADLAMLHALEPMIGQTTTQKEWGTEVKVGDNVARSQLIVQTILKRAGQLAPKKYGEKLAVEHSVDESLAARVNRAKQRVDGAK